MAVGREIRLFVHGFVRLDDAMATDLSVINSARVSFARRKDEMDDSDRGLVRFLMRDRHGCYDDATDVLTDSGWKPWPKVTGEELFATRAPDGRLEYQPALRLVRKEHRGHMIGFKGMSVDLLVTPDHRVLAEQTTTLPARRAPVFSLRPAHSVLWRSHRHTARAAWSGPTPARLRFDGAWFPSASFLRLVGLFIGDGNLAESNHVTFNIRKAREIGSLEQVVSELGLELKRWRHCWAVPLSPQMREIFAECYERREKVMPRRLLDFGPSLLSCLLEGLIASDGSRTNRGPGREDRVVYHTTSRRLADAVQELSMKIGRSASVRPHATRSGDGHYGRKPGYRVVIDSARNTPPALCRTREQADNHMGVDEYDGLIHCVEVPNSTLYVRRNGYPVFCGNTPFEHNAFRFHVRCPLFVAREWFRHRVGSFNEESARYHQLEGDFYVPTPEDVRSQVGKPGAYTFEPVGPEQAERVRDELADHYERAYALYQELIDRGLAKELARCVLPMGTFTQFYWTVNARSLMNFLSLRTAETAQLEIRAYAEAIEELFAVMMPVTYEAFVANGRVAP